MPCELCRFCYACMVFRNDKKDDDIKSEEKEDNEDTVQEKDEDRQ